MAGFHLSRYLDEHLGEGLKALKSKYGTPEAEAIRRAVSEYLDRQGVAVDSKEAAPRRASTRRKA